MKRFARSPRNAFTLIETLIFVAVWTLLAVAVMRSLGDGRMLRGRARYHGIMTLIAQEELERARLIPAAELTAGAAERADPSWAPEIHSTTKLSPRGDGTWLIEVAVQRDSVQGYSPVRLATIRQGSEITHD